MNRQVIMAFMIPAVLVAVLATFTLAFHQGGVRAALTPGSSK